MRLAVPQFLSDVVRDLRDRRLLPLALLLLAGLVAVPVVLSRSSDSPQPPALPAAAALPDDATQAQAAVLTEQVGIRDYRKRLEAFKNKNPFKQQFKLPPISDEAVGETAAITDPGGGTATGPGPGSGGASTNSQADGPTPTEGGTSGISSSSGQAPKPQIRFFTRRVDVKVGPEGELEERLGVRTLTVLPSRHAPVVTYLGTDEAGDQAVFLVSADVTDVDTDGRCTPSSSDCQFLVLQEGEGARLHYGPDPVTYVLRLNEIRSVFLPDGADRPQKAARSASEPPLAG